MHQKMNRIACRGLALCSLVFLGACSQPTKEAKEPAPPSPQVGGSDATPQGEKGELKPVPEAIRELEKKLGAGATRPQPSQPVKATAPIDEPALVREAEEMISNFVGALQKGNVEEAKKFTFSKELFAKSVTPGTRDIIEATILGQNALVVEKLVGAVQGKNVLHKWVPGKIEPTPGQHTFIDSVPCMSKTVLEITADDTPLEIRIDQLVHIGEKWSIFSLSAQ